MFTRFSKGVGHPHDWLPAIGCCPGSGIALRTELVGGLPVVEEAADHTPPYQCLLLRLYPLIVIEVKTVGVVEAWEVGNVHSGVPNHPADTIPLEIGLTCLGRLP